MSESINQMTAKEFCAQLCQGAVQIANGEREEIRFPCMMVGSHVIPDDVAKVTPSYMRTVINRLPEVKARGRMSIKREVNEEGVRFYVITLNTDVKRKVLTQNDIGNLESKWRAKFIKHLLETTPRITDLQGDQLTGAAIALERFAVMLERMGKDDA